MVSNIYVSVSGPEESHDERYRRSRHHWLLSVEPHHRHIPGTKHKDVEPIHYTATRNPETGLYAISTRQLPGEPGIIGNILIAEEAHVSAEAVQKFLEEEFGPDSSDVFSKDSTDDEPEHWVRRAIHGLQRRQISPTFDISEFIMFAHGYISNRLEGEAPALIAYPKIHKEHEKKSSKHRFWISFPMADHTKTNARGEATLYGGLM